MQTDVYEMSVSVSYDARGTRRIRLLKLLRMAMIVCLFMAWSYAIAVAAAFVQEGSGAATLWLMQFVIYTIPATAVLICAWIALSKLNRAFDYCLAEDQLEIWAERSGASIVRQHEGADPASVVFDGIQSAKAKGVDVILIDTAGRLHNKQNLMNELNKISRIVERELPGVARETLLVLDGTTGQNGLIQAKQFKEIAGVTAIALTKLDGTAKGGIVIAVADALQIPVKFVGVGEKADDLMPFVATDFVEALL